MIFKVDFMFILNLINVPLGHWLIISYESIKVLKNGHTKRFQQLNSYNDLKGI